MTNNNADTYPRCEKCGESILDEFTDGWDGDLCGECLEKSGEGFV